MGNRRLAEDERSNEAQEGKCFGQGETDEHVLTDDTVSLWLTGNRLNTVTEDDADTDTWADGRKSVSDCSQVSGNLCDQIHHLLSFFSRSPRTIREVGRPCLVLVAERSCNV